MDFLLWGLMMVPRENTGGQLTALPRGGGGIGDRCGHRGLRLSGGRGGEQLPWVSGPTLALRGSGRRDC